MDQIRRVEVSVKAQTTNGKELAFIKVEGLQTGFRQESDAELVDKVEIVENSLKSTSTLKETISEHVTEIPLKTECEEKEDAF